MRTDDIDYRALELAHDLLHKRAGLYYNAMRGHLQKLGDRCLEESNRKFDELLAKRDCPMTDRQIPADGFEVFDDPAYFDMVALRRIGETSFEKTLHFGTRDQAIHASHVIAEMIGPSNMQKMHNAPAAEQGRVQGAD